MKLRTKICGVSTPEALDAAIAGGASHIGFVFFAKSPRNILFEGAAALAAKLPNSVAPVALVVDAQDAFIASIIERIPNLGAIQFHGEESPDRLGRWSGRGFELWKAVPIRLSADLKAATAYAGVADRILYDAKPPQGAALPGGTGQRFDWSILNGAHHPLPWILAGGLDAHNLQEAHAITNADFFDVSSGVECAPGIKDVDKIAAFLKAAQNL